ncbi:hypothetical protein [Salisediminibacterium halotolerans]|uniref:Uncharacterized protein n=1 Tax=Salisediminibacterium halotolerans TaxID=517425 RepID=A0A1H9RSG8_9BACI|nr:MULTISPECIES: hypothetical protein [Salisediminibacterium]RLJ74064.1 hypothetical protein BCL39_1348 [Actinophytocola xinjiangensis]RPE87843.1 hypothetical protein EDD67_1583 [Salisediminibacterium halotolerans]TWG34901.1 hypothetical protein BCL52_1345 [Salisediminibacterium halotolerans]SER75597.1 hypothetical protein SAMN05444126_10576 [Salisediminibacterium haloalkalitolerans]GEL07911.1 hypothetical protein SHA02_13270 [Salisediminibacterium halotolerans]
MGVHHYLTPYLIAGGILCIIALVVTIRIGMNPEDKEYENKSNAHFKILSFIYVVTFVPALVLTVLYFIYG